MSLHQLHAPSNRVAQAAEMQREDFLALASAIHRFNAAGPQAVLAIISAQYGFERPPESLSLRSNES